MLRIHRLFGGALFALCAPVFAQAEEMALGTLTASGSLDQNIVISAQPLHAMGPAQVSLVAFEVSGASGTWSMPPANDAGQHGDALAGDGLWSFAAEMGTAAPGDYEVTVYIVDSVGAEFVSAPVTVTLN